MTARLDSPPARARCDRGCQLCGSDSRRVLYDNTLAAIDGLDLSYRVARCVACGFVYASNLAAPHIYERYYRTLSKYDAYATAADIAPVDRERARLVARFCTAALGSAGAVADLGCGPGALLGAFKSEGWTRLSGLDPAPGTPEQARRLFGVDGVRQGDLRDAATVLALGDQDLVCLTGVLEHLPNLRDDLASLARALPAHARLLIEVPALDRFARGDFEPFGEFSMEHLQFFSAAALRRLLAGFGFSAEREAFIDAPRGSTDSILMLFCRASGTDRRAEAELDEVTIDTYIDESSRRLRVAVDRLLASAPERFVIYGAGAHTARLLPAVDQRGATSRIAGIVDGNPNLHGKTMARWTILEPGALPSLACKAVAISSFRSQQPIARMLASRYPGIDVVTLY